MARDIFSQWVAAAAGTKSNLVDHSPLLAGANLTSTNPDDFGWCVARAILVKWTPYSANFLELMRTPGLATMATSNFRPRRPIARLPPSFIIHRFSVMNGGLKSLGWSNRVSDFRYAPGVKRVISVPGTYPRAGDRDRNERNCDRCEHAGTPQCNRE